MADESEQVFCFLDHGRVCSGDCICYQGIPKEESPYLEPAQQHCVLLRSLEQTGRGVVVLGGAVRKELTDRRNREADVAREASIPRPAIPGKS